MPNTLDVITVGGNPIGVEFVRSIGGGRYVDRSDNFGGAFSRQNLRFRAGVARNGLYVLGTGLGHPTGQILVIGNTAPNDLRGGNSGVALSTDSADTTNPPDGTVQGTVLTFNNFTFQNDSPGKHYNIADSTVEIGLSGNALVWYEAAGIGEYDGLQDWSAANPVLVDGIASASDIRFSYDPGTPTASGVLQVGLTLNERGESIDLYEEIHVRNTP